MIYYVNKNSGMTETDRDKWIKWSNVDHACWYQFDGPLDVGVYKYHLDESSQTAKIYYFRSEYSDSINPRSGDFRIPAQTVASYEGTGSWKSEYTNAKYSKIYDVISIEENAFNASIKIANYIRWIRSVDFSKATNLTSIGGSAFSCNRSPFLSDSLIFAGNTDLHIGYLSFENKNSIKKVRIGRNITGWGENNDAFALHGGIDTLILEGNCKTIGKKAFISKTIKYLKIDAPLNWEGEGGGISGDCGAFNGCNISKLELTNRLTKFGIGSFYNAKGEGIDSVFIPNTITDFGRNIFENSTLRVLKFEEGLKEITSTNDGCFANSNKLEKIYFPSTLEKIDKNSFKDCSALKELVIPSSVLSIGDYAFYNTRLSDSLILVGNNDLCIGRDVFNNNGTSIKKIRIGRNITGWSGSRDQFVFSRIDTLILEGNFKTIGAYAFQDTKIDFLKIDVNIDWGDGHTFENTTSGSENGVKKLVLGEKFNECTSIGAYVFAWNQKMESDIDLSKLRNLTIIKNRAFYQCGNNNNKGKISVISLPRSVKTIEENAFYDVKCDSVKIQDLKDWCKIDFANGHSAPFYANGKSQASLFVDTSKNYEGKYVCQDEEMIIPADVNKIGQYAFDGYKKLKSAILPNKIDTIGKSVFENGDSLNTIIWLGNKKNFDYKEKTFSGSKKVSRTLYLRDSNFVREVKGKSGFCDSIDVVRPLVLGTIENKSGENTFFYKKTGKASCQTIAIPDTIQKLEMRCWGPSFVERYDTTIEGGTKEIKGELSIPKDVTVGESTYKVNFIGDTS
ncbi:MAG TPA: hypothetical protein DDY68_06175, partial [Porphyromonadaceae bacterium]|nr:hypothetical protein [Porphyromonadaceae bacterium]